MRNSRLYAPSAPLKSLASVGCSGRRLMFERRTPLCCSNELPEAGHGKREENDGETNRLWVVPRRSKFCRLSAQRSVRGCRRSRTNKQRGGIAPPTPSCGSTHQQRIIVLKTTLGTVARSAVLRLQSTAGWPRSSAVDAGCRRRDRCGRRCGRDGRGWRPSRGVSQNFTRFSEAVPQIFASPPLGTGFPRTSPSTVALAGRLDIRSGRGRRSDLQQAWLPSRACEVEQGPEGSIFSHPRPQGWGCGNLGGRVLGWILTA